MVMCWFCMGGEGDRREHENSGLERGHRMVDTAFVGDYGFFSIQSD